VARLAERKLQVGAVTRKIRDHVARLFGT
jgi:hypothetical protein